MAISILALPLFLNALVLGHILIISSLIFTSELQLQALSAHPTRVMTVNVVNFANTKSETGGLTYFHGGDAYVALCPIRLTRSGIEPVGCSFYIDALNSRPALVRVHAYRTLSFDGPNMNYKSYRISCHDRNRFPPVSN
ncbi:hypothetical protein EVAR_55452_1 [Eumeta japonica]|uniref:Uncharacterized protein n=1 Tax=Eumeta variegata TaxID=151549 RepID=A0A4C1Y5L4_EUMVA|nr:hypothetical protein EVAR_55452_1 [Eumeta japonica]